MLGCAYNTIEMKEKHIKQNNTSKSARKLGKSGSGKKKGLPPGSLVHIGQVKTDSTSIELIEYDQKSIVTKSRVSLAEASKHLETPKTTWIKVTGLQDTNIIGELGKAFRMHPLLIEDILNTGQRPKVELMEDYIFLTMKTLGLSSDKTVVSDQISFVLRKNVLISFHESELSLFEPLKERMKLENSRLRTHGVDYLFYALIDIIVDNYFEVIEAMAEVMDDIEDKLYGDPDDKILEKIQYIKKELLFVKKAVFPLREAVNTLTKVETPLIDQQQIRYLSDVYDHIMQIYETVENYRDLNAGLKDMYLSILSNRMNKVMQVLTIIATIFIPLTFIAGIYGMNFEFMPELHWKYAYPLVWVIMIGTALVMLRMFRKNKWL